MNTIIELHEAEPVHQECGLRFKSDPYSLTGGPVRNPGHPHVVHVWENKPNTDPTHRFRYPDGTEMPPVGAGAFIGPDGFSTDDQFTVSLDARAVIIDGRPHPRAGELVQGETVELTVDGEPFGTFEIVSRVSRLQDPVLRPVS